MCKMPLMVLASSALVGLGAAYLVTHAGKENPPELPPNVFVSADQQTLVELPDEPKPLPAEPPPMPMLLQPEPIPVPGDGREVTISLRQPDEEESIPPPTPMPEASLSETIASPEEAPPSAELISMPTEEPDYSFLHQDMPSLETEPGTAIAPIVPSEEEPPSAQCGPLPLPGLVMEASRPSVSARYWDGLPLTGTYPCHLEDDAKLNLPLALRQRLQGTKEFNELYVGLAPDQKCLWVYSNFGVDRLVRQIMRHPMDSDEMTCNLRVCLSRLQCVPGDMSGAFTLPPELIEAAGLEKDVVLIGVRDHFELWDAKSWQEYSEGKPRADASRQMNELLNTSDDFRKVESEWKRIWFTDQPSHLTPERTNGNIE